MCSKENYCLPFKNVPGINPTCNTRNSSLSTFIPMALCSNPTNSCNRLVKNKHKVAICSEFHCVPTQKQAAAKAMPMSYLVHRLHGREYFLARLKLVSTIMSFFGLLGIILMIIENEIVFAHVENTDTVATWFIKLIITLSTTILVVLIFYYHYLDLTAYAFRNTLNDWRVKITSRKVMIIAIEVLVCIIHPMPRAYPHVDAQKSNSVPYPLSYTAIDVALGLPMFLRFYLLGRTIKMHSSFIQQMPLRSLRFFSHVSLDACFLVKTYLQQWPIQCVLALSTVVFLIGSWCLRACDYKPRGEHMSMSDAMWLFIITATTVGYGDQYPSTYCGRSIAAIISLFGLLFSALLIAIIAQKLQLSREQKYLQTFASTIQLTKKLQNQAANVIKFAIKSWLLKQQDKSTSIKYFQVQRKLLRSIRSAQTIKHDEETLVDSCVGFTELITEQRTTNVRAVETAIQIVAIKTEVKSIRNELYSLNRQISVIQDTLSLLLDTLQKQEPREQKQKVFWL